MPARNENAMASLNVSDTAQQFGFGDGQIIVWNGVTFRNPEEAILNCSFFDQPVNEETVVAHNQNDLPWSQVFGRDGSNRKQIARPEGWKHAHSPCP
jgi:hypothetical protein